MPLKLLDLHPNRALLDPNFDGYKLSLAKFSMLKEELATPVHIALPSVDQYSYLNAKLFSVHNHLTGDPFEFFGAVYFTNADFEVQKAYIDAWSDEVTVVKVWDIPRSNRNLGDYNVSLVFVSQNLAALSDGSGCLYLLNTGSRSYDNTWQCVFSDEVIGAAKHFIIKDAMLLNNLIHCLLFFVGQDAVLKKTATVLNLITLSRADDNTWGCIAFRELNCKGDILYAHLEPNGSAIYCVSDSTCNFTLDSENPIQPNSGVKSSRSFQWMQTSDTVKLKFVLTDNYVQDNFSINIKEDEIDVSYQNETFLKGCFVYEVDVDQSSWNVATDILEICLKKKTVGTTWPDVVIGDNEGKYISTQNFGSTQHLEESETSTLSEFGSTFNNQQIEECDFEDQDKLISFERLCVKTHEVTHRATFGVNSVLLTTNRIEGVAPALVIRNDVDGCIWQPSGEETDFTLKHEATLFAFGYIQASKQQKKFCACAPDLSYCVICESRSHIFIYQQNKPINNAELRNRTNGKRFGTVAQQHVISMPGDEILGLHATNSKLFILTENSVTVLMI